MGWSDWFGGSDGREASYKSGIDGKDGSFKSERISREPGSSKHDHKIAKGSSDGSQYKEVYRGEHSERGEREHSGGMTSAGERGGNGRMGSHNW